MGSRSDLQACRDQRVTQLSQMVDDPARMLGNHSVVAQGSNACTSNRELPLATPVLLCALVQR